MPQITDAPRGTSRPNSRRYKQPYQHISPKALDRNLLTATWNTRAFGGLTEKWAVGQNDSPKRDLYALRCIADIISRSYVVAVQEVRANLKALRHLLKVLGPHWGMMLTNVKCSPT